ncbi:hypothetical protein PIB30_048705 [Stylosanthes scabra]|uniref:Uncharacterized protein n=1 Tax=Stylosanthes scabra TaxID=79078 RepID=A0ABU6THH8_9FABA|nr:hypothetical protein [Stylosanthes scabra]
MEQSSTSTEKNLKHQSLVNIVFSWTLEDVLNQKLYKNQVQKIPLTFSSTEQYLNSFTLPLVEETHSDLCSGVEGVSQAPFCVMTIQRSEDFRPPKSLFYKMRVNKITEEVQNVGKYEPESGDIVAFTDVRPRGIHDLIRPKMQYHIAYICGSKDEFTDEIEVLSSKFLDMDSGFTRNIYKTQKLYVVYLLNMTTNIRIWEALAPGSNMNIIKKVLQPLEPNSDIEEVCQICFSGENKTQSPAQRLAQSIIRAQNLNDSQRDSVLSCVAMSECHHNHNVKLIWGPPGTGKTKTVACLLYSLLQSKVSTLTCAPTNTAVLTVASRLHSLVKQPKFDTYGLGNIVLFGNKNRMKVDNFPGLEDVFLEYRVKDLLKCFMPLTGWKHHLELTIKLLNNPKEQYDSYRPELNDKGDVMSLEEFAKKSNSNVDRAYSSYQRRVKSNNLLTFEQFVEKKFNGIVESYNLYVEDKKMNAAGMTMEQFVKQRFNYIGGKLKWFMKALYTHLPTSMISFIVVKEMFTALDLLKSLEISLRNAKFKEDFHWCEDGKRLRSILSSLSRSISLPNITSEYVISMFCIQKACLVFCTASSSSKLATQDEGGKMFRFVVIDEAAQLKECESAIPLQLPGLQHAVLIGDERQLPALVKSKVDSEIL